LNINTAKKKLKLYTAFVFLFASLMHVFSAKSSYIENSKLYVGYSDEDVTLCNLYGVLAVISCCLSAMFMIKIYNLGLKLNNETNETYDRDDEN